MEEYEIYEKGSLVVIFLGTMGMRGVLIFREESGWEYEPTGSITWDSLHQEVYRNFKGDRLTEAGLKERGVTIPSFEQYEKQLRGIEWKDNFNSETPASRVPAPVLQEIMRHEGQPVDAWLILEEDYYETALGDGKYLYPQAAFWSETEAKDQMEKGEKNPAKREWYRYSLARVTLSLDNSKKKVVANLNIEPFQHYSIEDVVRLLGKKRRRRTG